MYEYVKPMVVGRNEIVQAPVIGAFVAGFFFGIGLAIGQRLATAIVGWVMK